MKPIDGRSCTAFRGQELLATGRMVDVALAAKTWLDKHPKTKVLIFDDENGHQIEFDFRGGEEKFLSRLKDMIGADSRATEPEAKTGPGRPKLGVVSREIGLLPRHWEWLGRQPEGASAALRKLVEDAQKKYAAGDELRRLQDSVQRFMTAMAGDLPNYEEVLRAFYAKDRTKYSKLMGDWPKDVRDHAMKIAKPVFMDSKA